MSIIAGGKDSKLNFCSHRTNNSVAEWSSASSECQKNKVGKRVGVLFAVGKFGNSEGNKNAFPDRSLIQYPRGMHICN